MNIWHVFGFGNSVSEFNVKSQKYNAFLLPQGYTLTYATYNCNRYYDHYDKTRMHSSRLRTVRCSGRRGGLPQYMLGYTGVSAPMHAGIHTPLNRMTDRQVLKHYLSATSLWRVITTCPGDSCIQCALSVTYVMGKQLWQALAHKLQPITVMNKEV